MHCVSGYQLVAIAERTSTGPVRSQPRLVNILNGTLGGRIELLQPTAGSQLEGRAGGQTVASPITKVTIDN